MSDYRLRTEVNRVIEQAHIDEPKECLCSIIRIVKMRNKGVNLDRIVKVTKQLID